MKCKHIYAVRPPNMKLWIVALTAGAAVTVNGVVAVVPALVNAGDVWSSLGEALTRIDTLWDLVQFVSIPFIRVGLWVLDRASYAVQDL